MMLKAGKKLREQAEKNIEASIEEIKGKKTPLQRAFRKMTNGFNREAYTAEQEANLAKIRGLE